MDTNDEFEKLKPVIRSMVLSHRNKTVPMQELQRDFEKMEGYPIPCARAGFANVYELLHAMPDIVKISIRNGRPTVTHISSPATEHVEQLIQRSSCRRRGGRITYPPNVYRPQSYTPRYQCFQQAYPVLPGTFAPQQIPQPSRYRYGSYTPKNQSFEEAYPSLAETVAPQREITEASVSPIEDDSNRNNQEQPSTSSKQPTAKDSNADMDETCEHVDGSVMSWNPYWDMWDSVNMMGMPSGVMSLSHTIPNADISQLFSEKAETNVRILHVLNPNRIWLVSVLQDNTMEQVHEQMQEFYQTIQSDEWNVDACSVQHGLYCAVPFKNVWYRARIVGPLIGSQVKLFFIDTGLIELVDYKGIKFLFHVFGVIAAQAIRASLAGLIPKNNAWTRAESENFIAGFTLSKQVLTAYTLNINHKLRVLDIVLKTANNININEKFASITNARWTGEIYLSQESAEYRNKRQSFNEKRPSFFCIEEGHFPTVSELRKFVSRNFDFEELYTRLPHFDKNGVVEKISRDTNENMVKHYGIVSATNEEEITSQELEE